MGVLNVTPDSFSDGGDYTSVGEAVSAGLLMAHQGAAVIDVGGESTRPGSDPVSADEEAERVLPVVERLVAGGVVVSVDTSKPNVTTAAIDAGAEIVNDVTACATPGMAELVAGADVGVVLMHSKGAPRTMQENPVYEDVVEEVSAYLRSRLDVLVDAGASSESLAIDPGIGFGKTAAHNLELLAGLASLARLGHPIVLGTSRKSFLGAIAGIAEPKARDGVTAVSTALGYDRGARVFRVHDVPSSRDALAVASAIVTSQQWEEWSQG